MPTVPEKPPADESIDDSFRKIFPGVDFHVMTTIVANMTEEQRAKALHEEATHDGKVYEVVWVEKGDWQADGRHWNTMIRMFFLRPE